MTEEPTKMIGELPPETDSPPVISSRDLLTGHREIIIQHNSEQYRLRLTNSNKLILCK